MYAEVSEALLGTTGALSLLADAVHDQFIAALPVALPVVGGIAVAFFGIKVVRALLHI